MSLASSIVELMSGWAHAVASLVVDGIERLASPNVARFVEREGGQFVLYPSAKNKDKSVAIGTLGATLQSDPAAAALRGSRVEIILAAKNFMFRTVELPAQASDFIDGIVRSQIDRLSPWTVSTALFGHTAPVPIDASRIATTIAVMPREAAMPFVNAALDLNPASVAVLAATEEPGNQTVKVFEQKAKSILNVPMLARAIIVVMSVACVGAILAAAVAYIWTDRLEADRAIVVQQISQSQLAMRAGNDSPDRAAVKALERQKYDAPMMTLMLEALSKRLPDNTFLTELHVIGNKLQMSGFSRDAPSLIRLIEQSPDFARATFFAPTTRSPTDPGEQFHIEVRLEPRKAGQP